MPRQLAHSTPVGVYSDFSEDALRDALSVEKFYTWQFEPHRWRHQGIVFVQKRGVVGPMAQKMLVN
jgi:hypothetical protein